MNLTRISVDGLSDDWVGRAVIEGDPAGDSEAGFLDLTNGFAFVNEHALYLLVETVDRNAPFEQFEIYLRAGSTCATWPYRTASPFPGSTSWPASAAAQHGAP